MKPSSSDQISVFSVLLLCACFGFVSGCQKSEQKVTNEAVLRVKLELRPEASGEKSRIHKFNAEDVEVETEINYHSGAKEIRLFDAQTGKLKERKTWTGGNYNKLSVHTKLADDGKTIAWQEKYDYYGNVASHTLMLDTGKHQIKYFRDQKLFAQSLVTCTEHKDGSGEISVETFSEAFASTTVNYSYAWSASGEIVEKQYFANGKVKQLSKFEANGSLVCTIYRENGTIDYRQYFQFTNPKLKTNSFMTAKQILKCEVFAYDGSKIVKTFVFRGYGSSLKEVTLLEKDGQTRVVTFDQDSQTVTGEKIFDSSSKLVSESSTSTLSSWELQSLLNGRYTYLTSIFRPGQLDELKSLFTLALDENK